MQPEPEVQWYTWTEKHFNGIWAHQVNRDRESIPTGQQTDDGRNFVETPRGTHREMSFTQILAVGSVHRDALGTT